MKSLIGWLTPIVCSFYLLLLQFEPEKMSSQIVARILVKVFNSIFYSAYYFTCEQKTISLLACLDWLIWAYLPI